jgi:soluble lytic murein transglycosylase-like protein
MQLEELSNISDNLAMMPDPALQQFAQMHKTDPYMVSLALSESNRRKKLRTAAQGQAGSMPQPRVVDAAIQGMAPAPAPAPASVAQTQLPENQGIAQIPTPNMRTLADGGIAGYEDDEEGMATGGMGGMFNFAQQSEPVMRMSGGGVPGYAKGDKVVDYRQAIIDEAKRQGVPPEVALQISGVESNFDPKARPIDPKTGKPRSSATSFFQVIDETFKNLGGKPEKRTDPMENIRIGVKSLAENQAALAKKLGRTPEASELYTTHVLGAPTGAKLLSADPQMSVKQFLKEADPTRADSIINANPEVLGGKKTVGDVLSWTQKKMAPILTAAIPIGSAQAAQVPQAKTAAAAPTLPEGLTEKEIEALSKPAFLTPSSGKGRKEGKLSEVIKSGEAPRQMMLAAGDLPYNLVGGVADISHDISKVFGNKSAPPSLGSRSMKDFATKYLGREPDPTDPTLKGFRTAGELGSMMVDPMSATRKVAKSAEGLEALAAAQRAKVVEAEAKAAQTQPLRIEPPSAPQTIVADMQGNAVLPTGLSAETRARQQLEAQDIAQKALADRAARGVEAGRLAQTEKQLGEIPSLTQRAEMERLATMSDKARGVGVAAKVGDEATMRNLGITTTTPTYDPNNMEPVRPDEFGTAEEKAVVQAAKEVTPAKERKGFGDDDLLMLGLSLMANKSPNFMTALGEAGIQTLGAKREREKGDTEKLYRDALIEQAKRPSSEVQLIEKYRDDPKFAEAYDKFAQARRDPQSREALTKSWNNSIYLQSKYPNFEDYLKMMEPASGSGASGSQLNASDKSLIDKYLR